MASGQPEIRYVLVAERLLETPRMNLLLAASMPIPGYIVDERSVDACAAGEGRYSITSSARRSSEGETASPGAFAVFRLIPSSYVVGTGMVPGFSPLRMRSTYDAPILPAKP